MFSVQTGHNFDPVGYQSRSPGSTRTRYRLSWFDGTIRNGGGMKADPRRIFFVLHWGKDLWRKTSGQVKMVLCLLLIYIFFMVA